MRLVPALVLMTGLFLFPTAAFAAERTVTLEVENMTCPLCPITVKSALQKIDGVKEVVVSLEDHTAAVVFDDEITGVALLVRATTDAGYPSAPKEN